MLLTKSRVAPPAPFRFSGPTSPPIPEAPRKVASKPRAPVKKSPGKPALFAEPAQFRAWNAKHHATAPELLVGFYKRDSGKPSITWPESVDQALCFGWIDGVRKRLDYVSYTIRFTPRRAGSNWSS